MSRSPLTVISMAILLLSLSTACGGSSSSAGTVTAVLTTEGDAPTVPAPVSQYSILVEDLDDSQNYLADTGSTWTLTVDIYSQTGAFANQEEGLAYLTAWGYREGYQTALVPEDVEDALFNGGFIVHQELHLFSDPAGAKAAFGYFTGAVRQNGISEALDVAVGDEAFGSRTVVGRIGGSSNVEQAVHQVIFRRANVLAVVLTVGAAPSMDIETARELSAIVDEKIAGQRERSEPTPAPTRDTEVSGQASR